ncbi:MAG TPA: EAL domain-containing protein [Thauera sp.]|mgnify:FL=1|nr:EAL domain-containing protein [Thauera sp.]HRK10884.1 EAL domain-containing protein [Thauera sp.]
MPHQTPDPSLPAELQIAYLGGVLDHLPQGISVFDAELKLLYWNAHFLEVLDLPADAVHAGVPFEDLIMFPASRGEYGPGDPVEHVRARKALALRFEAHRFERTRPNGRTHLVSGEPLLIDGQLAGFITTYTDITDRKRMEEALQISHARLRSIIDNIPGGVTLFDDNLQLLACNDMLRRLLDFPDALFANGLPSLETLFRFNAERGEYGPGDPEIIVRDLLARARQRIPHIFERVRPDGTVLLIQGQALQDGSFVTVYTDITELRRAEERLNHLAHHDPLTGLANRLTLDEHMRMRVAESTRDQRRFAVLFLDLDRFKTINDSLGHQMGDALLVMVGRRLHAAVRQTDLVARLGGDEFVVVLSAVEQEASIAHVAAKILTALSAPYVVNGEVLHAPPSIGISVFPDDAQDAVSLLRNADTAMYHAKAQGRANYQFYSEELNRSAMARLDLERKLRNAAAGGEFELWYQPQYRACDGQAIGVEALLRWRHPQDGLIPPDRFIPICEDNGMILDIGRWVMEKACAQLASWRNAGLAPLRMAINVSARQLRDTRIIDLLRAQIERHGIGSGELEFEVTESSVMERPDEAAFILGRIKALGVSLAIDDFGTGHSSLAYLKRFPLDRLKIDRSFVSDIEHDCNDAAIVSAAISLAHGLGLEVVAEGVESAVQWAQLKALGCDELQGYHFSRPLPAEQLEPLLRAALNLPAAGATPADPQDPACP